MEADNENIIDEQNQIETNDNLPKYIPDNWREMNIPEEIKKLPKVEKPDYQKQKNLAQGIKTKIEQISGKIKIVDDQIASALSGSNNGQDKRSEIIAQMKAKKTERANVSNLRKEKLAAKDQLKSTFKNSNAKVRSMKTGLKYTSLEEIDQAIKDLEFKYETDDLTPNQSKELLREIQLLKGSKSSVGQFAQVDNQFANDKESFKSCNEEITTLGARIGTLSEEINKLEDLLFEMDKSKTNTKVQTLRDEKNKLYDERSKLYDERQKCNDDFNLLIHQFEIYSIELRKLNTIKKKQDDARRKEEEEKRRLQKEEEDRKIAEEIAEKKRNTKPYQTELDTIEKLKIYLNSILPKDNSDITKNNNVNTNNTNTNNNNNNESTQNKQREIKLSNGTVQVQLKKEELMFGGEGKKNKNKNKNKPKKNNNNINLSLQTFNDFESIKLLPPKSADQIRETLNKLEERKTYYESLPQEETEVVKVEVQKEENDAKVE